MPQLYRILRNNKESGPFQLEELLALSLKPTDLIWVEGETNGWQFPTEISSLRPYFAPSDTPRPSAPVNPSFSSTHPASQPSREAMSQPETGPQPQIEEEINAEKLEKKAAELFMRVQSFNRQKEEGVKNEPETKYERSLDDLKQEYADWLEKQKAKKKFSLPRIARPSAKVAALCAACLALVLISVGLLNRKPSSEQAENLPKLEASLMSSNVIAQGSGATEAVAHYSSNASSVDDFLDSVRKVLAISEQKNSKVKLSYRAPKKYTPILSSQPLADSPASASKTVRADSVNLPVKKVNMNAHYEQDATKRTVSFLEVTIQNNTPELLRSVTVDVFYYKKSDKLFDRETLYFNNIAPGNSITVSRPGNKRASSARFQLGQIESLDNRP